MSPGQGSNASANRSSDHNGEEEDEGLRIIITHDNGDLMSEDHAEAFRIALENEVRNFHVRERNRPNFVRIRVDKWKPVNGTWVLTPAGTNPHLNGARLIQLVDRIQVGGLRFRARWNTDMPRYATLVARFSGGGNARELIEDPHLGLVATNEWPDDLQGQVRFVSSQQEEGSNYRLVRFEATEAVVSRIQEQNGFVSIGLDRATVQNNKNPVKRGSQVIYRLQK